MTAATNRRNRRAQARSRCRARASWTGRADRLTTMQSGGTTGTMSWFSRGAMRNQYETGVIKATYGYTDINNNLRVAQDAAGLTTSTYDGDNLRRKIVSGSVTTTFVWDGADYLQIKPSSGDATLLVVLDGEVVGHVKGSEKRDYIVDPLGSVVAYLNSSQTLTDQFEYWPYGELISEVETGTEAFLWVGSLGYFRDTDLRTYIRAREYRQDLGSWMQLDRLWPAMKPYVYAGGSVFRYIDPSGNECVEKRDSRYWWVPVNPLIWYRLDWTWVHRTCHWECPCTGPDRGYAIRREVSEFVIFPNTPGNNFGLILNIGALALLCVSGGGEAIAACGAIATAAAAGLLVSCKDKSGAWCIRVNKRQTLCNGYEYKFGVGCCGD